MRRILASLMMLMAISAAMGFVADPVAAADVTIPAGDQFSISVTVSEDSIISYSWNSDGTLTFILRDQAMNMLRNSTGTLGTGLYTVDHGGFYTLLWINSINTGAVNLKYDVQTIDVGVGFLDDIGDAIVLGMLIVLAIIAIIVVIVVLVVVKGKNQRPVAGPGAPVVHPMGNNCALCGMPISATLAFCPKCGAKLR